MNQKPDSELTTQQLLARDWTKTLIERFLPTHDGTTSVNHWANFGETKTYSAARVWAAEQSDEFGNAFLRSWRGRMKKRRPEQVLAELRKTPKPGGDQD
jgi:hypothetical protein